MADSAQPCCMQVYKCDDHSMTLKLSLIFMCSEKGYKTHDATCQVHSLLPGTLACRNILQKRVEFCSAYTHCVIAIDRAQQRYWKTDMNQKRLLNIVPAAVLRIVVYRIFVLRKSLASVRLTLCSFVYLCREGREICKHL